MWGLKKHLQPCGSYFCNCFCKPSRIFHIIIWILVRDSWHLYLQSTQHIKRTILTSWDYTSSCSVSHSNNKFREKDEVAWHWPLYQRESTHFSKPQQNFCLKIGGLHPDNIIELGMKGYLHKCCTCKAEHVLFLLQWCEPIWRSTIISTLQAFLLYNSEGNTRGWWSGYVRKEHPHMMNNGIKPSIIHLGKQWASSM